MKETIRIISAGKGGAGKTTIMAALLMRLLQRHQDDDLRIMVMDADPAATMAIRLGWGDNINIKGIGQLKDELSLDADLPPEYDDKQTYVLTKIREEAVYRQRVLGNTVDFSAMGHHKENQCMCAFNSTVNDVTMKLLTSKFYDYILMDRDAGLEHINRNVYGEAGDVMFVVAWPTHDYMTVAKKIFDVSDSVGTNRKVLVVNSFAMGDVTEERARNLAKQYGMEPAKLFTFPTVELDMSVSKMLSLPKVTRHLDNMLDYVESLRTETQL